MNTIRVWWKLWLREFRCRSADTCGNENRYFAGYFQADTLEEAQQEFPHGAFTGFVVQEVVPSTAQEIKDLVKHKTRSSSLREWL